MNRPKRLIKPTPKVCSALSSYLKRNKTTIYKQATLLQPVCVLHKLQTKVERIEFDQNEPIEEVEIKVFPEDIKLLPIELPCTSRTSARGSCRICLTSTEDELVDLFTRETTGDCESYADKITFCSGIEV